MGLSSSGCLPTGFLFEKNRILPWPWQLMRISCIFFVVVAHGQVNAVVESIQQTNGKSIARISLPIFILTSFSLEWGSAVLIDWLSVVLTLCGIYCLILHKRTNSKVSAWLITSIFVLIFASLTKVTTTIPWLIAFVILFTLKNKQVKNDVKIIIISSDQARY